MKLETIKYGTVSIRWEYNLTNGDRDVTKAYLEQKNGNEWKVIKEVSVVRKPSERYDKELARKFALAKLVKESFSEISKNNDEVIFQRTPDLFKDREQIWKTYRTRKSIK